MLFIGTAKKRSVGISKTLENNTVDDVIQVHGVNKLKIHTISSSNKNTPRDHRQAYFRIQDELVLVKHVT
ncbi:hypothetical protein BT69DRAFT_1276760 [Atractiella rhizophila]|nr:hypothetical protein BT69DRAFT_1283764 [Atractiella rhizophila]KAH8928835.1 hypothetical protein BT69DRAFT_1276760 [Atractiella rhizophila]